MPGRRDGKDVSSKRKVKDVATDDDVATKRMRSEDLPVGSTSEVRSSPPAESDTATVPSDLPNFIPGFSPGHSPAGDLDTTSDNEPDMPPEDSDSVFTIRQQAALVNFWQHQDTPKPNTLHSSNLLCRTSLLHRI